MRKQRIKKNIKQYSGITLISLVITIIILIILAGVTLSIVLGENGLLAKARKGAEDYQYAGLRERIESEILALDMEKVVKGETLTIEDALIGLQANGTFEETDAASKSGTCEGYVVELGYNADGKVVINGITKDTGTRIVATINPTGYTNQKVEVTISVKGNEKNVTNIEVQDGMTKKAGTSEQDYIYEVKTNGTYHVKATLEDGTTIEKEIVIATIDKLSPNDFEITAENTGTGIIVTAETEDADANNTNAKSGMDKYEYVVTDTNKIVTTYTTNPIENLEYGKYSVYVIAYDKAGNHKQSTNTEEVEVKQKLKFQQVSGNGCTLAIDENGNLWSWGNNASGQLGDGTKNNSLIPKQIIIDEEPNKKWKQVSSGDYHSLAIDENGNLWAWGKNDYGQLGDGTKNNSLIPKQITIEDNPKLKFKQISTSKSQYPYNVAIDENGSLWAWGDNQFGSLGDGTKNDSYTPKQIMIENNENIKFKQVDAGNAHCLAIDENGNLWAWGNNADGQLGDGTKSSSLIPKKITIDNSENIKFKKVTANNGSSLAIDENDNLWAWGENKFGSLGDGTTNNISSPKQIIIESKPDTKFSKVSTGSWHTLVIDEEGNLYSCGRNHAGQLGNGKSGDSYNQMSLERIIVEGKPELKFQKVVGCGQVYSLAIDTNGYLWAWGGNGRKFR